MFGAPKVRINYHAQVDLPYKIEMLEGSIENTNQRIEKLETLVFSLLDHLGLEIPNPFTPILKLVNKEK